jgi:hypothetical protein
LFESNTIHAVKKIKTKPSVGGSEKIKKWLAGRQAGDERADQYVRQARSEKKNKAVRTWARGRVGAGLVWVGGAEDGLDD